MEFSSINIQGNIISSEILNKIRNEEIKFQQAVDFGLEKKTTVRDEIGIAWAAARAHYTAFKLRVERIKEGDSGASETRNSWMLPLLRELGYDVEKANAFIHPDTQKSYAISHKAANLGDFPIHIMGIHDDLDRRREASGPRLSPHALTQEYLNNTEHTYALVTNGQYLRLLRDATRLVRLSYLEFDLLKMMEEDLYADFAILFRLLHATRMPKNTEALEESYIEYYHQDSLASGSRIREKLSEAVETSIKTLANGFLKHPSNEELRKQVRTSSLPASDYYLHQLRLIYRFLFLIVTEERNLVYPDTSEESLQRKRKIYYEFYSIERLRKLAAKLHYIDGRKHDLWEGLKATFLLFEKGYYGEKLGIKPLGSGLFSVSALGSLPDCKLDNESLLKVIRHLTLFENDNKQWVRVNYSDLDVEEFGSVYEGLLEYDAEITEIDAIPYFRFKQGTGRSSSGSHYTPEELVKPLIKHSLDYLITDNLKEADPEKALLSLKVADVACGSGHILLSAARRIAFELACIRETKAGGGRDKVEQPSPRFVRAALRDVIKNCIYGVDKNPLAVELCKVALWLEAHNPGEPLNFLDHHIKCGDAIVGVGRMEELERGIPSEAFKAVPDDDKTVTAQLKKTNDKERKDRLVMKQATLEFMKAASESYKVIMSSLNEWSILPENTPDEVENKTKAYTQLTRGIKWFRMQQLSNMQTAQFLIPKKNTRDFITDATFFKYLSGNNTIQDVAVAMATAKCSEQKVFDWFIEFPDVFAQGGFDCILGNPPFLGGQKLTGTFGNRFLEFLKYEYAPAGAVDLVTYFFRRTYELIKHKGFISLISTNTIAQGGAREAGLDVMVKNGATINHAIRSMKWPGVAAVEVALVTVHKGSWDKKYILGNKEVNNITPYLDDAEVQGNPYPLKQNEGKSFQGSIVLGKGFVLEPEQAQALIDKDVKNKEVLFPYLNGDDLNNNPDQSPSRWVINFFDWPLRRYTSEEWKALEQAERDKIRQRIKDEKVVALATPDYEKEVAADYPDCLEIVERLVKPERQRWKTDAEGNDIVGEYALRAPLPELWWIYGEKRPALYKTISGLERVMVINRHTKFLMNSFTNCDKVFSDATVILALNDFMSFSVFHSFALNSWAWTYSGRMGDSTLRFSPSACFENFPFPDKNNFKQLEKFGESFSDLRSKILFAIQLGLTDLYNCFNSKGIKYEDIISLSKQPQENCKQAYQDLLKLRELQIQMDNEVLEAYGWKDIQLRHDFYEVDYLPENDRVRFTIHPEARKEVLKRLLELNHKLYEEEIKQGLHKEDDVKKFYEQKGEEVPTEVLLLIGKSKKEKPAKTPKVKKKNENQTDLF